MESALCFYTSKKCYHTAALFFPKTVGDILHGAPHISIEPLIGGAGAQAATLGIEAADLDVVEQAGIAREHCVTRIPRHFEPRFGTKITCQRLNIIREAVPPHKAETGNLPSVLCQQIVQHLGIQLMSDILMQVGTMALRASMRTIGEVDGKSHFIGNLLENDVVIIKLQIHGNDAAVKARGVRRRGWEVLFLFRRPCGHRNDGAPPSAGLARSC